uniref:Uncharacterized protein n=1 Tax=Oryza sativa subsp. japonica TaxID=39947 RepID=Q67W13_ORYSJ|nr:hypothetical protein [Oryza sativa Japonica Group]
MRTGAHRRGCGSKGSSSRTQATPLSWKPAQARTAELLSPPDLPAWAAAALSRLPAGGEPSRRATAAQVDEALASGLRRRTRRKERGGKEDMRRPRAIGVPCGPTTP